jgi:hypothetical protein
MVQRNRARAALIWAPIMPFEPRLIRRPY